MRRGELLKNATQRLTDARVEDPRPTAEGMLSRALSIDRTQLYLNPYVPVGSEFAARFERMLERRIEGEPIEYILGEMEFYGSRFRVHPGVLIPRPESELLVEHAKRLAPKGGFERALDVGCGSGALALTLLKQRITREVVAVDVSREAVKTTAENASRSGFELVNRGGPKSVIRALDKSSRILFERGLYNPRTRKTETESLWLVHADAFAVTFRPPGHPFPLIVSNPPYIADGEWDELPVHIREHEPEQALRGGEDGLDIHRKLARRLKNWLAPGGVFLGEIGWQQGASAKALHGAWAANVTIHQDYAGLDRIVEAWRPAGRRGR
ncbi:MAG: Release factor glutamine methyltransferase [Calditrichaeota bacterium]|nr:Release factor glutamine methyltransferase [Calditrichota bacterium]